MNGVVSLLQEEGCILKVNLLINFLVSLVVLFRGSPKTFSTEYACKIFPNSFQSRLTQGRSGPQ